MPENHCTADELAPLDDALRRLGLLDSSATARWTRLTGGLLPDPKNFPWGAP